MLQNSIGFGLGLLCAPIFMHFAPELVPATMILNSLFVTSLVCYKNKASIQLCNFSFATFGGVIGIFAAGATAAFVAPEIYRLIFGVIILSAVALSVKGFNFKIKPSSSILAGAASGFMGTLTSAGGAPMGLLYQNSQQKLIKANLNAFFVIINLLGLISLYIANLVTMQDFVNSLYCIPALIIGWYAAAWVKFNDKSNRLKNFILSITAFAGVSILFS